MPPPKSPNPKSQPQIPTLGGEEKEESNIIQTQVLRTGHLTCPPPFDPLVEIRNRTHTPDYSVSDTTIFMENIPTEEKTRLVRETKTYMYVAFAVAAVTTGFLIYFSLTSK